MDGEGERAKVGSLLGNANARMSHLDVPGMSRAGEDEDGSGPSGKRGGGLAAKAGIILVGLASSICSCPDVDTDITGYSQHLHRDPTVLDYGDIVDHLCYCQYWRR